jgi:hypothetical protein
VRFVRRYLERKSQPSLTLRQVDPLIRQFHLYRNQIQEEPSNPAMNISELECSLRQLRTATGTFIGALELVPCPPGRRQKTFSGGPSASSPSAMLSLVVPRDAPLLDELADAVDAGTRQSVHGNTDPVPLLIIDGFLYAQGGGWDRCLPEWPIVFIGILSGRIPPVRQFIKWRAGKPMRVVAGQFFVGLRRKPEA